MIRFTRKLTKKITNTGHDSYVLSIPREIADELKLPYGGLVSLRIWAYRNEVLIENYEESWHPYQEVFSPAKLGFVDVEIEPKTRGRSRGFAEGRGSRSETVLARSQGAVQIPGRYNAGASSKAQALN